MGIETPIEFLWFLYLSFERGKDVNFHSGSMSKYIDAYASDSWH